MSDPWMKFYPADWRSDPGLRKCSFAARGLWADLLCLMHEADPRGYLFVGNSAPTSKQLASILGSTVKEVNRLLGELSEAGVYSIQMGIIYSRRMVRDEKKRAILRENGLKGGNPALILDNQVLKSKKLESRVQSPESREKESEACASPPSKTKRQKRPLIQIPDDFHLTTGRVKIAADMGLDAEETFTRFRRWAVLSGKCVTDWDLRWLQWCEDQITRAAKDAAIGAHRITHYGDDGLPRYLGDNDG